MFLFCSEIRTKKFPQHRKQLLRSNIRPVQDGCRPRSYTDSMSACTSFPTSCTFGI
jgi:hypothetical protein